MSYAPEEIVLDERMPNLLPFYNTGEGGHLFDTAMGWSQRKIFSFVESCPTASTFNPNLNRKTGFVYDYVRYPRVLKVRFPTTNFSFHLDVNPGWEWRDLECLEDLTAHHALAADFAAT